jgi:hypothetical protein
VLPGYSSTNREIGRCTVIWHRTGRCRALGQAASLPLMLALQVAAWIGSETIGRRSACRSISFRFQRAGAHSGQRRAELEDKIQAIAHVPAPRSLTISKPGAVGIAAYCCMNFRA